jgi:hypothetical protein
MAPAGQAAGQHTPADHSDSFSRPSFREAAWVANVLGWILRFIGV